MKSTIFTTAALILFASCASNNGNADKIKSLEKKLIEREQTVTELKRDLNVTTAILEMVVFDTPFENEIPTGLFDHPYLDKKSCAFSCAAEAKTLAQAECEPGADLLTKMTCKAKIVKAKAKCAMQCKF